MEPDVKEFLIRIMQTLSMALVWLLINMSVGIYYGFAFFEGHATWSNYLYYVCFIASFGWLIYYFIKKWKGWKEIGE